METRFLESFVVFTESRSLVEASRKLALTPAALSLRFKALEDELGYPILSRVGRIVRPTAAGLRLAEKSRAVIQRTRDLRTLGDDPELAGEIRLGVASSAVAGVLCNLLLDIANVYANAPADVFPQAMTLMADLVRNPAFANEELERQHRLAGARLAANQDALAGDGHAGRVDRRHRGGHSAAIWRGARGRRAMKRAPRTVGSPSSSAGPGRFSAWNSRSVPNRTASPASLAIAALSSAVEGSRRAPRSPMT